MDSKKIFGLAAVTVLASAALVVGPASAATRFTSTGTTVNLTPGNQTQAFSAGTSVGGDYYYTFTTSGEYDLEFTETGTLDAAFVDNPFTVSTGSVPGSGTTEATSTFGTVSSFANVILDAGTYTLLVPDTTADEAISGNVSAAAVPEATSWALMLLGVGAVGAVMRRRPRVASAVAG